MAVRPGYKQTEVGMIPEDWDVKPLGDIGDCLIGLTYSPNNVRDHGTLVLRSSNIQDGSLTFDDNVYVDAVIPERIVVQDGDILICVRNGSRRLIGKCALLDNRVAGQTFGAFMSVFRTPESAFVFYQFQSDLIKRQIDENIGATINQITNANLNAFKIPLPSSSQERITIAAALSDVDALLAKLDQFIAKKRDLKQAAMQELLTGQTRLPGFHGEWEVTLIEECGEILTGGTPRTDIKEYWGEGYPWITPTDIASGRDISASERSITRQGLDTIRALPKNTVLVTCIASIGKNAILRTAGGCNQQINAVVPNKDNCAEFLYYLFEASKQYLLANAGTTATSMISKATFSKLTFSTPSFQEQTAIATVLSDMDAELAALEARRDKTRALKQGMMQELLTGRIRLV